MKRTFTTRTYSSATDKHFCVQCWQNIPDGGKHALIGCNDRNFHLCSQCAGNLAAALTTASGVSAILGVDN